MPRTICDTLHIYLNIGIFFFFSFLPLFHCLKPFNLRNGVFRPEVIRKDRENQLDLIEMIRENEEWIPKN